MSDVIDLTHGITESTPDNVLLGAGVYFRGLHYDPDAKKWVGTPIGATSGGGKISIKGELMDLELDGALVKFKGQTVKQGGTASIEASFAEIKPDILKIANQFKEGTSDADGYTLLEDKESIDEGDYVDGFGFVGRTATGNKKIIVIFESALCTSGLELEPKGKTQGVVKVTMEAYADGVENLSALPVKIYYPTAA